MKTRKSAKKPEPRLQAWNTRKLACTPVERLMTMEEDYVASYYRPRRNPFQTVIEHS